MFAVDGNEVPVRVLRDASSDGQACAWLAIDEQQDDVFDHELAAVV